MNDSVWTITAIGIERYLAVCHPLSSVKYPRLHRTPVIFAFIVVAAVIGNLPRYWEYTPCSHSGRTEQHSPGLPVAVWVNGTVYLDHGEGKLSEHAVYVWLMDGV